MAPDGRMYNTSRKGELFELKEGLNATTMKDRKNALKRTVAAMTLGKDVSSLFTDVVKNTAVSLPMKKLVYLYIVNYAPSKPDLAILIVNTFVKDAADPNPLVRALAIRTMSLIPLDRIFEYLCAPLHAALHDQDPYVRKTAAVCVAKVYDSNPQLVLEEGFIPELQDLLSDGSPMTVANAVAALAEIADASGRPELLLLTPSTVPRFLSALSECTEWGQIFILDAISTYVPADADETDGMVERIIPRLQHANPAVVLSAIRIIVNLMPHLDSDDKRAFLIKKMSAPLVSLLTSQPEMQFVALRNISLLIRQYPSLLSGNVKVFFVSYSDPLYVKSEKLDVLVRLTDESNATVVLAELREYVNEVDIEFVRKAVASIGRIAMSVPPVADRCVSLFGNLLQSKVTHIAEEIAVALKDILRAYPGRFAPILAALCEASDCIDDPAARAALIWIIGEHAGSIPNAVSMLDVALESLAEEATQVQLQILTACVKAYLVRGADARHSLENALAYATTESENVDVRDRGFAYSRLVAGNPENARKVVLATKPGIQDDSHHIAPALLKELLGVLSSIASVYHKPAASFRGVRERAPSSGVGDLLTAEEDLLGLDTEAAVPSPAAITDGSVMSTSEPENGNSAPKGMGTSLLDELFGDAGTGGGSGGTTGAPLAISASRDVDLLASLGMDGSSAGFAAQRTTPRKELLDAQRGKGLAIRGGLVSPGPGEHAIELEFTNSSDSPMTGFALQLNKNFFGLKLAGPLRVSEPLVSGARATSSVPAHIGGSSDVDLSKGMSLQMAIKSSPVGVVYFVETISDTLDAALDAGAGPMKKNVFQSSWVAVPDATETNVSVVADASIANSIDELSKRLEASRIFTVAKRKTATPAVLYLSASVSTMPKCVVMAELTLPVVQGTNTLSLASRCTLGASGGAPVLSAFSATCARILRPL